MKLLSLLKLSIITLVVSGLIGFHQGKRSNNELISVKKAIVYKKNIIPAKLDVLNIGNPYITNYNFGDSEQIWSITQDEEGTMLFAYRKGVFVFDGLNRHEIPTKSIPLVTKSLLHNNVILIGSNNDYGYMKKGNNGAYKYKSLLSNNILSGEISEIKVNNKNIFYYSEKALIQLRKSDFSYQNSWIAGKDEKFKGIVQVNDKIFLNKGKGLHEINKDGELRLVNKSNFISGKKIVSDIYFRKSKTIIGTEKNKLYLFDGKKINPYKISAQEYIEESIRFVHFDEIKDFVVENHAWSD